MSSTLLLTVQNAVVRFGDKHLFNDLSFNIRENEKICLVGKNGAGKTTLMNIITGTHALDGGLRWQLAGCTIGYLLQDVHPKPGQTVRDYIFEELKNQDGSHDYKIERVLEPLDLHIDDRLETLSGGQLRGAALARALVEDPDILLLDEPTNHLDLDIIRWLETYLQGFRGAIICISHDKAFLEHVSDKVFWLDRGKLKICPRGFRFFDEWAVMLLEQEERELLNRQKVLDQEVDWASRGVKARRKRNIRRVELMKIERDKLRTDKSALTRMLAKIEYTPQETEQASSRMIVQFFNVSKAFNEESTQKVILEKFNLRILRGDRIGIIGKNGSGKTSFLSMLVGESQADSGTIKRAKDLSFSYFDQKRTDLIGEHSLHRFLCPNGSDYINVMGKSRHVAGYLKDFLFDPRMLFRPVNTLSGGQKNRLMLAKILANPGNLLILDEPTNDLDMETLDRLEEILSQYTGTLLVVSHDRDFLDQTVSKILAFEGNGRVEGIIGGYQDYLAAHKDKHNVPAAVGRGVRAVVRPPRDLSGTPNPAQPDMTYALKKLTYIQQYELDNLPSRMEGLEAEIAKLEGEIADPDLYVKDNKAFERITNRLMRARDELESAETRWLTLSAMAGNT